MDGIAVSSGGNGWEGDGGDGVVVGEAEGFAIATGEGCGFVACASAIIDGTHGVDNIFCSEAASGGEDGLAGGETVDFGDDALALFEDGRTAGTMDGAIDAASAEEGRIGGVDDGFGGLFGDVGGAVEFEGLVVGESEFGEEGGHGDG